MSENISPAEREKSLENYLLGITYLQSVASKDFDEASFISDQVSDAELVSGLLTTSLMLLSLASDQLKISKEEVLLKMRVIANSSSSSNS